MSDDLEPRAGGVSDRWKRAWAEPRFRVRAVATPFALLGVLRLYAVVLAGIERRRGVVLPDPILALVAPRDVAWLTFALVYGVILAGVVRLAAHPHAAVIGTQAYVIMTLLRILALYVTPLDPPIDMIALRDPFTERVAVDAVLTRDLFFSGHTATVFLFALGVPGRWVRRCFLVASALVGAAVLVQHVHYAVDVAAAPLASLAAYRMSLWLNANPSVTPSR